jgi:hypothetical protein
MGVTLGSKMQWAGEGLLWLGRLVCFLDLAVGSVSWFENLPIAYVEKQKGSKSKC